MSIRNLFDLLLLAALWGGSFLCLRVAVPEFGPMAMIFCRVAFAALSLLPLMVINGLLKELKGQAKFLLTMGLLMSAISFPLFAWASHSLTAGSLAIFNATAPFWTAIVAWLWLGEKLSQSRILGMVIGLIGVIIVAWDKIGFKGDGSILAVLACLVATLCYGFGANLSKIQKLPPSPLTIAFGSQLSSTIVLAPFALYAWPKQLPSGIAWVMAIISGVACTALAYILYFRLIKNVGSNKTVTVTFIIPLFGIFWGAIFLHETPTAGMLVGGAVILLGTALATGLLTLPQRRSAES